MLHDEPPGETRDRLRLLRSKAARTHDFENTRLGHTRHGGGIVGHGEEARRDLVHPRVRALSAEEDGDQERVGVFVRQRNRWIGV